VTRKLLRSLFTVQLGRPGERAVTKSSAKSGDASHMSSLANGLGVTLDGEACSSADAPRSRSSCRTDSRAKNLSILVNGFENGLGAVLRLQGGRL
jgi:hypothetical protein